ncbi:hypothetical protein D3A96_05425 [Robertkochia marina]|nr:hypothetical protein D3A96_05425 [Robertkochia marina]
MLDSDFLKCYLNPYNEGLYNHSLKKKLQVSGISFNHGAGVKIKQKIGVTKGELLRVINGFFGDAGRWGYGEVGMWGDRTGVKGSGNLS